MTHSGHHEGPYLFDVGVIALAHTGAPVRDAALSYVRRAIAGEIEAVVPHPALIGAHTVFTTYYGRSNTDASRLLENFRDARRVNWCDRLSEAAVRGGFERAGAANVDGWDGYYAEVASAEGVNTVVTLDDDFERFEEFATEILLSLVEFEELNAYLKG
ncbi:hypothetical protein BRC99_06385 [Halobacteriales archaeon QS_7_69_60]|nr:MAG: hypothetical protein BRC99_06385 [Halobacteriales archaeon QS_7_69_60]